MSAYNWIKFDEICPTCKEFVGIKAQSKMASSYNGTTDRFHNKEYRIGDTMKWWTKDDTRYDDWNKSNQMTKLDINSIKECCYSICLSCESKLYAVIEFKNITPTKVVKLGVEANYPNEYYK